MAELTTEQKREHFNKIHYSIDDVLSSIREDITDLSAKEAQDVNDINNKIDAVMNAHSKDISDLKNDCTSIQKELGESVVHIEDSTQELNFDQLNGAVMNSDATEWIKNGATIRTEGNGLGNPDVLVLEATTTKIVPRNSAACATISASNISFTDSSGTEHTVAYDDTVEAIANAINNVATDEINNRKQAISNLANDINNLASDTSKDLYNKVSYTVSDNVETISTEHAGLDTLVINANNTTVSATDTVIIGNCSDDGNGTYTATTNSDVWSGVLSDNATQQHESSTYVHTDGIEQRWYNSNSNITQESTFTLGEAFFDLYASETSKVTNMTATSQITTNLDKVDIFNTLTDTTNKQSIRGELKTAYNVINAAVTDTLNKTSASFEVTTGYSPTSSTRMSHSVSSFVRDQRPVELGPNARLTSQSTNVVANPNMFSVFRYDQVDHSSTGTWPARSGIMLRTNLDAADATSGDPLFGAQQFQVSLCSSGLVNGTNLYFDEKDLLHADAYDKTTGGTKYFKYIYDGYDALHIASTSAGEAVNILDDTGIRTSNLNASVITTDTINANIVYTKSIINPDYDNTWSSNSIAINEDGTRLYRSSYDDEDGTSSSAEIQVYSRGDLDIKANGENYTASISLFGGRANSSMRLVTKGEGSDSITLDTSNLDIVVDNINAKVSYDTVLNCTNITTNSSENTKINANTSLDITADAINITAQTDIQLNGNHIRVAGANRWYSHAYDISAPAKVSLEDTYANCVRVGGNYISLKAYNGFAMAGTTYEALADLEEWTFTLADGSTTKKLVLASSSYRTR